MRRNAGATAALLQKANSQLRGEKIEKPEDELNAYISSLTQKTVKSQKSVNFEDLGESISISSDIEEVKPQAVASVGSKFLKKKPGQDTTDSSPAGNNNTAGSKFLKNPQTSAVSPSPAASTVKPRYGGQSAASSGQSFGRPGSQQSGGRQVSSALDKASALTGKFQQKSAVRKSYTLDSESDESYGNLKLSAVGDQLSDSVTTESAKIGRDGGKFLKKATPSLAAATPTPARETTKQNEATKPTQPGSGWRPGQSATTPQKKASPFQLKSSMKYSTDVILTSEEESLAEFVGGLPSSSDSMDKPKQQHKRRPARHTPSPPLKVGRGHRSPSPTGQPKPSAKTPSKHRSPSPQSKPPMIRRTPSPSPRAGDRNSPGLRRRSPSPRVLRSYSDDSNVADSIIDEVAEEFDFGMNVIMDLDDLGPTVEEDLPPRPETPLSRSDSPVRSTARKSSRSGAKSPSQGKKKDKGKKSVEKDTSPFKASGKKDKSPFRANEPSQSPFKANDRDSPFKANMENKSPFRAAENASPFRARSDDSPFRASNEGSVFKSSHVENSPFKSGKSLKKGKDRSEKSERSDGRSKKKGKKSEKSGKKKDSGKDDDFFGTFNLQTVDDLLGHQSGKDSEYDDYVKSEIEEVPSEISEIHTEHTKTNIRYDDSATEIPSEIEDVRPTVATYTDDFDSVSERIGYSSDRRYSSASEVKTRYSGEDSVASYTEYSTESDTETYTETRSKSEQSEYDSYSEDFTKSLVPSNTTRSDVTPRPPHGMATEGVQTSLEGLLFSWNPQGTGLSFPGAPYGLGFVDPTPIAAHMVSADALEAMTSYSPAMLALHDMLKSQLDLTREFIAMQKHIQTQTTEKIQPRYQYTTLEDTKKYIKQHKKKKLSFKEALRLVDMDTARQGKRS
ncbi:CS044-like protein [Mya arenaria]|uniref:CS044-like protein n=1 Tax=Mya arenaria TaxID=6604 RepID=A0ABY7FT61_MYAAR|nr:serine/arginine repetitive matrix protein 1-like isoform X2 [Mya arenaria]WAR24008.1 CS044-like protein [Mya arenaria]